MNTDSIEVCGADPDEIRARLEAVIGTQLSPVEDRRGFPRWYRLYDMENELAVDVAADTGPLGYTGPTSWIVELRARLMPDERRPIVQQWWDALAEGTDWHLIWWSDDDPDDGIVRERLSVNGPNSHSAEWVRQTSAIDRFRGEYFFLSNFYPATTPHRGHLFPSSEHAYMAARTDDQAAIAAILATSDPADAQRIGRAAPLVDDWENRRFAVMEEIVTAKFSHNPELADKLRATAGRQLVEGNDWHDQTWGSCRCDEHRDTPGGNALGVILMGVRMRLPA